MRREQLIGGRVVGVRWRWRSKPARLVHRLAVRVGLMQPPVVRVSLMQEAMAVLADDWSRQLFDLTRKQLDLRKGGRIEWCPADAVYSPIGGMTS